MERRLGSDGDPVVLGGRRVLVTGHTGFKGAWLSLWLQELGAEVTGFSLHRPSEPALFDLAEVGDGMRSIEGDVRDLAAVKDAVTQSGAEVVVHPAAQPIVRRSFRAGGDLRNRRDGHRARARRRAQV